MDTPEPSPAVPTQAAQAAPPEPAPAQEPVAPARSLDRWLLFAVAAIIVALGVWWLLR